MFQTVDVKRLSFSAINVRLACLCLSTYMDLCLARSCGSFTTNVTERMKT